ncbi:crossover junction endodeoxyribonuclease RuvC [Candidatus Latescibacterota bacterium]
MRILGIDPGLNITGYGIVETDTEQLKLIEAGVIKTIRTLSLEQRLSELYRGVEEVSREFHPDVFAVEEIYSNYKHPKTAVIMGHARGVLFLVAGMADIPVYSYSATRIKKSLTGGGHASKEQIARMVANVVDCGETPLRSDVTDAIAAALCHINTISHGGLY